MANGLTNLQQMLFGSDPQMEQIPRFSPQQQQGQEQALQQALQMLQGLQQQQPGAGFEQIAQQRRQEFAEETLPTIQERFTAMTGGGQRTGAQPQAAVRAGEKLESDLASLQAQQMQKERGQQGQLAQSLLQLGMQPQFDIQPIQGRPGALSQIGGLAGGLLGQPQGLAQLLQLLGIGR